MDILADIIEILIGGISDFGSGLASGINGFVKSLFLEYNATSGAYEGLSTFGIITIAFMGLALAIGITRWVVRFVRNRG